MADKKTYSGMSRKEVTIPAYSVTTIDYLDTKPNYFRVQNLGASDIYCGVSSMPTANRHDFMVKPSTMKMYADPFQTTRFYVYNPSGSEVSVIVVSFAAEFDPLALALGEIEITVPSVITAASTIDGFNAPLPTGSNKIGNVGISGAIPSGSNKIGSVGLDTTEKNALSNAANYLQNLIKNSGVSGAVNLNDLLYHLSTISGSIDKDYYTECADSTTNAVTLYAPDNYFIEKIVLCSNDGDSDKVVSWVDRADGATHTLVIKPGEDINDIPVNASSVSFEAGGGRIAVKVRAV